MSGALTPLESSEIAEKFSALRPEPPIMALAVSGGSDSMALAWCAKQWGDAHGVACIAFIVDHALRPESADEARLVQQRVLSLGMPAEILRWQHDPITHKLHEQARAARYALLDAACQKHGIKSLLLGHHRDDQAETILMRLAKGSGIEGLAGMAAQTTRHSLRLLRPFLDVPKQRLIATCEAAGIAYVIDPSNASEKYARGRLRQVMPLLAHEGLSVDRLIDLGERAAEANKALNHMAGQLLRETADYGLGGDIHLDRHRLMAAPRAIGLRVLADCLRHIHPSDYPPERAALLGLWDALAANDGTRTLYGCLIASTEKHIHILREAAATETIPFMPDRPVLWDGRWVVEGRVEVDEVKMTIRALGNPPHDVLDQLAPNLRRQIPQGRVRATLPALYKDDHLYAIPDFDIGTKLSMRIQHCHIKQ